jgi:hypothetical protein
MTAAGMIISPLSKNPMTFLRISVLIQALMVVMRLSAPIRSVKIRILTIYRE